MARSLLCNAGASRYHNRLRVIPFSANDIRGNRMGFRGATRKALEKLSACSHRT
jgi:hypothetical protein